MFKKEILKVNGVMCGVIKWISFGLGIISVISLFISIQFYSSNKIDLELIYTNIVTQIALIALYVAMFIFNSKAEVYFKKIQNYSEEEILEIKGSILNWSVGAIFLSALLAGILGVIYYLFLPDSN
ncbi:MAG: hypothetical protein LBV58_03140 [Acholeplasmatales bacterium]|jgi:hypothetical protein|nr:hypothetical protein [Acholeplasmatales bacterium]